MPGDDNGALIDAHVQRGDELLAEIDAHLRRGIAHATPAHLAHGAELELRLARHLARWEEAILAGRVDYESWRFATRRDGLRNERVLGEASQSLVRRTHELVRYFVEEGRGHRDALWRIVDKFDRNGGPQQVWPFTAPSYRR